MRAEKAYRRGSLQWPLSAEQVSGLNQDIDDIYQRLRAVRPSTAGAAGERGAMGPPGWDGDDGGEPRWPMFAPVRAQAPGDVVAASVYRATDQTLTSAVEAAITLSTEHFDSDNLWDGGAATRLTVPASQDGTYLVRGQVGFATAFAGTAHLRIYKNGTLVATASSVGADLAAGTEARQVAWIGELVATDYVELKVLLELSAGGTYDIKGGTNATFFQIVKQSPQTTGVGGGGGSGGIVLLDEQTASASATLDFASIISSTYDTYLIELINVLPATDGANLLLRFSTDNGSTFDSGNNYAYSSHFSNQAAFESATGSGATSSVFAGGTASNTAAAGGICGTVKLFNPLNAAQHKLTQSEVSFLANDTNRYRMQIAGFYLSTTAVDAFRFLFDAGNITSGTIRVYGIVKV